MGTDRQVEIDGGEIVTMETYSIPEASKALGKGVSNFRRWLDKELIPEPYLTELSRGLKVYSQAEMEIYARLLAEHEQEFAYYCSQHTELKERIFAAVTAHRSQFY